MGITFTAEIADQSLGARNEILLRRGTRFAAPVTELGSLEVGNGPLHAGGGGHYLTTLTGRGRALQYLLSANTVDAEMGRRY